MAGEYTNPNLLTDEEIRELGVREDNIELYRRRHYSESFGIGSWYAQLSFCTFRTESVDLSFDDASAIVEVHYKSELKSAQLQKSYDELIERIDAKLKESFPGGAFVKLDTRSPKDVPVYDFENKVIQKLLNDELDKLSNINDEDSQTAAFVIATNRYLKITSGAQAVKLLTISTRVSPDLNRALDFGPKLFKAKIILREWDDYVPDHPEMEFRGFVRNNTLNALSQYFSFVRFPYLVKNKELVQKRILDFFESVKGLIPHESYVIDFLVMKDKVMIIEFNPFHIGAGACLFSWSTDRDIIMNGPFQFRITEKSHEAFEMCPAQWQRYINNYCHQKNEQQRNKLMLAVAAVAVIAAILYFYL